MFKKRKVDKGKKANDCIKIYELENMNILNVHDMVT